MPYGATFTANIKPLQDAIAEAKPTLGAFEQSTKKVQTALQRMVSEFDGTKVIQQAQLMVGAVDKLGDHTKLTEAEQRRVNAALDEALKKYNALGQDAPKAMRDLFEATKRVAQPIEEIPKKLSLTEQAFGKIGAIATGAFAALTFDRVVGGITRFAGKVIEAGGAINDLSAKTGVGVTALQRWQYAAEQNGNSLDQMTGAVTQMSNRLVGGDASAVGAINQLGLNFDRLRASSPEHAFEEIAGAIARVPDPMQQAALAIDVFGKSGAGILPTLKADLVELGDEAERLGLVMSSSTIEALDNLGDTIDKVTLAGEGAIARFFAPAVPLIDAVATAALSAAERFDQMAEAQARLATQRPGAGVATLFTAGPWQSNIAVLKLVGAALEDVQGPAVKTNALFSQGAKVLADWRSGIGNADIATHLMSKTIAEQNKQLRQLEADARKLQETTDQWLGRDLVARANAYVATFQRLHRALPATADMQREVNQALTAALPLVGKASDAYVELLIATTPVVETFDAKMVAAVLASSRVIDECRKPVGLLAYEFDRLHRISGNVPDALRIIQKNATPIKDPFGAAPNAGRDEFISGLVGGIGDAVVGAVQGGGSISQSIGAVIGSELGSVIGKKLGQSLGSALGKALGQAVGNAVGAVGGAIVGELVGSLFGKLLKEEGKRVNDVRDQFVLAAGGIDALAQKAQLAGTSLHEFLRADSVNEYNVAITKLQVAFAKLEQDIQGTVTQLQRVNEEGTLLSRGTLADLIKFRDQPGVRDALGSFIEGQTGRVVGGLQTFLSQGQVGSVGGAQALEGSILAAFGSLQQQGVPTLDALRQLEPAIAAFGAKTQQVVGFEASAAFGSLQSVIRLVNDEIAGPTIAAVGGLGDVMVGLNNTGWLTQDIFGGLSRTIYDSFHSLELMGKGGMDAARAMQQPLQRTWELVQDFGYTVDEDTQKLLDFAEQGGLIGDQFRPASERMVIAIETLVEKFAVFLDKLDRTPLVAGDAARGIEREFRGIRIDPISVDVELNYPSNYDGAPVRVPGFSGGTPGLMDFGPGTLAMLHGREAVVTEGQLKSLQRDAVIPPIYVYIGGQQVTPIIARGLRNETRLH